VEPPSWWKRENHLKTHTYKFLKNLKPCTFVIYSYMYSAAKVEMQTRYINIHMKMIKSKCICIEIHMPRNFACSALALQICYFHMIISTFSVHINFFNEVNL
jgi:hypothetical protein